VEATVVLCSQVRSKSQHRCHEGDECFEKGSRRVRQQHRALIGQVTLEAAMPTRTAILDHLEAAIINAMSQPADLVQAVERGVREVLASGCKTIADCVFHFLVRWERVSGSEKRKRWVPQLSSAFLGAYVLLLVACATFIAIAIDIYAPHDAIGPLSAWVPATITSLAVTYTLISQRRGDERQRAAAERQRETEAKVLEQARRAQAEKVYVWLERRRLTMGSDVCVVLASNVSDGPAYLCSIDLILSDASEQPMQLGTLPPQSRLLEWQLNSRVPTGKAATPADRFPIGVRCEFRDVQGQVWKRDPAGRLFD
jgi:hypothetical protein